MSDEPHQDQDLPHLLIPGKQASFEQVASAIHHQAACMLLDVPPQGIAPAELKRVTLARGVLSEVRYHTLVGHLLVHRFLEVNEQVPT